jgi:hypothetical protein
MGLKGSVRKWLDDNQSNDMTDYEESMHLAEFESFQTSALRKLSFFHMATYVLLNSRKQF